MNFTDDENTVRKGHTITIDDSFDVVCVRFQMRRSELEAIANGTEADKDALIAWLTPADE